MKTNWNLTDYYNFLNYNFSNFLDSFGWNLNESSTYKDYHALYDWYFKQQYQRKYYIADSHTYNNYLKGIYESLQTHDIHKFKNALYDYCPTIRYINVDTSGVLYVIAVTNDDISTIKQLCLLYGYYITSTSSAANNIIYIIETTFGYQDMTNEVYNKYQGILYHITSESRLHKILRIGLIPKHLDRKVTHPGRIYLSTNSDIKELQLLGKELYNDNVRYCIIKVDLSKMPNNVKLKFYTDPAYSEFGVFTCENIAPQCLITILCSKVFKLY